MKVSKYESTTTLNWKLDHLFTWLKVSFQLYLKKRGKTWVKVILTKIRGEKKNLKTEKMGHSRKIPILQIEINGMWSKEGADKTILKSMSQSHFCDVMRKSSSSLKKLPLLLKVPLVRISSIENKKSETQLKWKELSFYWTCQKSKKMLTVFENYKKSVAFSNQIFLHV